MKPFVQDSLLKAEALTLIEDNVHCILQSSELFKMRNQSEGCLVHDAGAFPWMVYVTVLEAICNSSFCLHTSTTSVKKSSQA